MLAVIVLLFSVAFARLSIWRCRPKSRVFTLALFSLGASYTLSLATLGDRRIDPALAGLFGENISDVVHTLLLVTACYLFGLIFVRVLSERHFRLIWTCYYIVTSTTLVVTSRFGEAASVPVDDEFELQDPWTRVYLWTFLLFLAATCLLIFAGTAKVFRRSRRTNRRIYLSLVAAGTVGVFYAMFAAAWLILDPDVMAENHGIIITLAAVPILGGLAIAGLYGVVDAWRVGAAFGLSPRPLPDPREPRGEAGG
ncbi:hypothetical protein [Nocardia asiatica]|uniref:hypothetical protein n=1 Tax=Nocardia asiatica TaxID=209252 RepID=UPI00245464A4|nr:hypothetical protein [Nocardia asiatica]